jgi:tetratricopeptide (TPR) repeat protein
MRRLGRFFRRRWWLALLLLAALTAGGWAGWSHWSARQLFRQAETALDAHEYAKARELFDRYLESCPDDARARLLAARAARRAKDYYAAREHLRRCRQDGGDAESIEIEETLILVQRGDERPVERLRARAERDDDLALAVLEVLIQHDLETTQLWLALDGLNKYLSRRPDDLQALLGRGFVWERVLYFADAAGDYRRAVAAHPDSERARLRLAETLLVVGPPDEALTQFQWLAERWPDRPDVRLGLARCWRQLGDADAARALLDGLVAEYPDHGEALWERGQLALDAGSPAEAEPLLRRAAARLPHDRRVQFALYRCLVALDRGPEAEAVNARVRRIDDDLRRLDQIRQDVLKRPNDPDLRYEGGVIFLRNGERQQGVRWLQLALRLDPGHRAARKALDEAGSPPRE